MLQKIPLNDLSRLSLLEAREIKAILARIVDSGEFILGSHVREFEIRLSKFINTKFAFAVASGTDALELGLRAAGIKAQDSIANVANAGGYATTAIRAIGALPHFIDCDEQGRMSLRDLRAQLGRNPKITAVVVTHLYGLSSNIIEVSKISKEFGVKLIEDCAQSIGAVEADKRIGTFGDLSTFSFYPTKNLGAFGDAGAVLTSDPQIAQAVAQLRQYGWSTRYVNDIEFGKNSRMDEFQAAILNFRLENIDKLNETRRRIWVRYSKALAGGAFRIIGFDSPSFVAHLGVIVSPSGLRDTAIKIVEDQGIQVGIHYPKLDTQQDAWSKFSGADIPVAKDLVQRIFTIPLFPTMSAEEVDRVESALHVLKGVGK